MLSCLLRVSRAVWRVTKQLVLAGTGLLMPWSLHFTPKHTMTNAQTYFGDGLLINHFPGPRPQKTVLIYKTLNIVHFGTSSVCWCGWFLRTRHTSDNDHLSPLTWQGGLWSGCLVSSLRVLTSLAAVLMLWPRLSASLWPRLSWSGDTRSGVLCACALTSLPGSSGPSVTSAWHSDSARCGDYKDSGWK